MQMNAQALVDQLNAFEDAKSIKDFFIQKGIKGYRQDENSCPISRWIGLNTNCAVTTEDTIKVYSSNWDDERDWYTYDEFQTSSIVKEFIDQFDQGFYPELDVDDDDYENPWL